MARGKADRQLTVGKKLEIIEEAERTGLIAVTAQKYGVKTGQIRDWKKNIERLKATDPSRLVCASTIQRGHLVFNETYAQYWVGYNKYCSQNTNYDELKDALRINQKDLLRDGINGFGFPSVIDPTTTAPLECPNCSGYYTTDDVKDAYNKDVASIRSQLAEFFEQKPFPTKYLYFVTRLDFYKPHTAPTTPATATPTLDDASASANAAATAVSLDDQPKELVDNGATTKPDEIDNYISMYVAICGNGSVMVPMSVFPPVEPWHWERKKPVKLRHAHAVHRIKKNDPNEALQFFSVTWKKFYDEEAKYSDKFAFLLDATVDEFRSPVFTDGLQRLDGYHKYWTTMYTVRNPLRLSHVEDILMTFISEEWKKILAMKKSSQPNDYRKCVAFWFYTAWELFAGDHARTSFRACNLYLEDKSQWSSVAGIDMPSSASSSTAAATAVPLGSPETATRVV